MLSITLLAILIITSQKHILRVAIHILKKTVHINEEIERLRHAATSALLSRRDVLIVASVSCIYGIGSVEDYGSMAIKIKARCTGCLGISF